MESREIELETLGALSARSVRFKGRDSRVNNVTFLLVEVFAEPRINFIMHKREKRENFTM